MIALYDCFVFDRVTHTQGLKVDVGACVAIHMVDTGKVLNVTLLVAPTRDIFVVERGPIL